MLPKVVEQTRKDFPAKMKTENAATTAFQKAVTNLPKTS